MTRTPRTAAFTLMEVLLAIGMVLALVGSLMAFYWTAMDVRKAVAAEADLLIAERAIMDDLTNELRAAMVYPFLNLGLEGSPHQLAFVSAALPGPAAWAVRQSTEDPIPPEQDLQLIGYELSADPNTGEILGLLRTCQKVLSAESPNLGRQTRWLSSQFRFLGFRYHDGATWQAEWRLEAPAQGGDQRTSLLPVAVEIILGTEPLPEEMALEDYVLVYPTFRRVVFLPGGARDSVGAGARSAQGGLP